MLATIIICQAQCSVHIGRPALELLDHLQLAHAACSHAAVISATQRLSNVRYLVLQNAQQDVLPYAKNAVVVIHACIRYSILGLTATCSARPNSQQQSASQFHSPVDILLLDCFVASKNESSPFASLFRWLRIRPASVTPLLLHHAAALCISFRSLRFLETLVLAQQPGVQQYSPTKIT